MKKLIYMFCCICLLLLFGCTPKETAVSKDFFSMDTYMKITVYGKHPDAVLEQCVSEVNRLDALFDKNKADSDIAKLNAADGQPVAVDASTIELLRFAKTFSELTKGSFDATIEPVVSLWGIGTDHAAVPDAALLSRAVSQIGWQQIHIDGELVQLDQGSSIDVGGIAKGYAADRVAEILKENGIIKAVISLGGNIYTLGEKSLNKPWQVGIQSPENPNQLIGTVAATNASVVTSGDYERYFEQDGKRYHHIFDPKTGFPAENDLRSVTILCESSIKADALSTALFVMGSEKALAFYQEHGGFEAVFVRTDGTVLSTDQIQLNLSK